MLGTEDADGPVGATDNVFGGVSEFARTLTLTTQDGNRRAEVMQEWSDCVPRR